MSARVSEREWVDQRKEVIRDLGAQPSAQRPPAARPCLSVPSARSQYDSTRPSPTVLAAVVRMSPQLDPHDPSSRVTLTCVRCRRSAELRLPASAPSEASGGAQKALSPSGERVLLPFSRPRIDKIEWPRYDPTILGHRTPRCLWYALEEARGPKLTQRRRDPGLRRPQKGRRRSAGGAERTLHHPVPSDPGSLLSGPAGTFYPGSPHLRSFMSAPECPGSTGERRSTPEGRAGQRPRHRAETDRRCPRPKKSHACTVGAVGAVGAVVP